jgi:hypothetical protein
MTIRTKSIARSRHAAVVATANPVTQMWISLRPRSIQLLAIVPAASDEVDGGQTYRLRQRHRSITGGT